jgi:hypothetical protein
VFRNQPAYPTKSGVLSSRAWQFSLSHATLRSARRRDLNGKDPAFDAGFEAAGVGRNPTAARLS